MVGACNLNKLDYPAITRAISLLGQEEGELMIENY